MMFMRSLLQCFGAVNLFHQRGHERITSIEDLPEDVILIIMSNFELRDIINFSATTKQWTHIPGFLGTLGFDRCVVDNEDVDEYVFVERVNQFLQHYINLRTKLALSSPLLYFGVSFNLTKRYSTEIDSWIFVAFRYGVTSLCVYLEPQNGPPLPNDEKYIFPLQLLLEYPPPMLKKLRLRSCIFQCPLLTFTWISLEVLELTDTPFTEYDLDRVLKYFPSLRKLVLQHCTGVDKLMFASDSLTNFKVMSCPDLKELKLFNFTALTKFTYDGDLIPLKLINAPKLTNVTFCFDAADVQNYVFQNLCLDFPLMRSLSIFRDGNTPMLLSSLNGRMSSFLSLQELKLYNHPAFSFSLETMKEILKASPILKRLEMIPPCMLEADAENVIKSNNLYLHKCLAFIKISGFCGSRGNVKLAKFLVQVSEALQHVVIQQKVEARLYLFPEHSADWHGDHEPEFIKNILLKLTRSQRLTFLRGKSCLP